ncbi:AAA family ATPase, partial [Thiolapillus sp.]
MIIKSVKAENVLKYASLELKDLPEQGIIAISGENESGKSTIGETVCFALFGRTFSLGPDNLDKVLRWGEHHCSVVLEFSVDGVDYQLSRFLDRDGNHSARLSKADDIDNPVARGVNSVADKLFEILGYEFDEFVESFYLAQREITTPHPHSVAVKTMAGVAPLERVAQEFEEEIADADEMLAEIDAEVEALRQEQEELDFEEGLLVRLEDRKNALEAETAANRAMLERLREAAEGYRRDFPAVRRARRKRARSRLWRFVAFVLALVAAAVWGLLSQAGDLPQAQQLHQLLQQQVSGWQDGWIPRIGAAAGVLAVLMAFFWMRVSFHDRREKELMAAGAVLARALEEARAVQPAPEEGEGGEEAAPERPEEALYARLLPRVESMQATPEELEPLLDGELAWLEAQARRREALLERLEQEVEQELERVRQMARLSEVIDGLEAKEAEIRAGQERRRRAIELLEGAAADFSNDFNKEIRELVAR